MCGHVTFLQRSKQMLSTTEDPSRASSTETILLPFSFLQPGKVQLTKSTGPW